MASSFITALEIGTTSIKVLMGDVRENGELMVLATGECDSRGVRKGEIIDFELALNAVRQTLKTAETNAKSLIGERVVLTASGGRAESKLHRAGIPVLNEYEEAGGEISQEDVEHVIDVARKIPLSNDRIRLHTLQQNFEVDGRGGISNPVGLLAEDLTVEMLLIHGNQSTVKNLTKLTQNVPLNCSDAAFGGFCSALAILTPEQKQAGAVVIDLGGGTTDFVVYNSGLVKLAGSLAVGGDHVTADISSGFSINRHKAEQLKIESGTAQLNQMADEQNISIPSEGGLDSRVIRSSALHTIINARMEETFRLIANQIEEHGLSGVLSAGILLTGGGSAMDGAVDLARQVFNAPAQIGKAQDCYGLSTKREGARFASVLGAIRYAASQTHEIPKSKMPRWLSKIWGSKETQI